MSKQSPQSEDFKETGEDATFSESGLHIGSYNIEYYLDDLLFGVSVVDLIPSGLISYYVYYDPVFKFLNLGTLSVFWENEYVLNKMKTYSEFKTLYLCFYVPVSPKMSYKVHFRPCELFCPAANTWVTFDEDVLAKINSGSIRLTDSEVPDLSLEDSFLKNDEDIFRSQILSLVKVYAFKSALKGSLAILLPKKIKEAWRMRNPDTGEMDELIQVDIYNPVLQFFMIDKYSLLFEKLKLKNTENLKFLIKNIE